VLLSNYEVRFSKGPVLLADRYLSKRSASVRRDRRRKSSSAIQLLTVPTISRLLCRSVFSGGSAGKLFNLSFLPRFRTLTPEFITSSHLSTECFPTSTKKLRNLPATPFWSVVKYLHGSQQRPGKRGCALRVLVPPWNSC